MKIQVANKETAFRRCAACALGNGSLSFLVDKEGTMKRAPWFDDVRNVASNIWQSGVRDDTCNAGLLGLGAFTQELDHADEPIDFQQTFDLDSALLTGSSQYDRGVEISSEIFCHSYYNVIVVRKKISGTTLPYRFLYHLNTPRILMHCNVTPITSAEISWAADTKTPHSGSIRIFTDVPCRFVALQDGCAAECMGREITFFLCFDSDAEKAARQYGWNGLLASHRQAWAAFWAESSLSLPADSRMAKVCRMAEYHLKISTTVWSIPVGIYPTHWQARYFGFDEFFAVDGLLATGHFSTAKHVPDFRYRTLPQAKARISRYTDPNGECADYPWEADETGQEERAPAGFWLKHIFHMANIVQSVLQYAHMANDMAFLQEKGYPVIRACAEYFRQHHVYCLVDDRCIVGKITDLERLGAARENAFMTTCGVIATFRAAADTAERFQQDAPLVAQWRQLAEDLKRDLPHDGEKYIPYPGCTEPSIAVFAGLYPYEGVVEPGDAKLLAALQFFLDNREKSGNMYPFGKSICTWYGAWNAIVLAWLGRTDEAWELLEKLAENTGCFCETYEIYESGNTPYFTTAEGIFLKAVAVISHSLRSK